MKMSIYKMLCLIMVLFVIQSCEERTGNQKQSNVEEIEEDIEDVLSLDVPVVVTDSPNEILTFEEASQLEKGTMLKLRINRDDHEVIEFMIEFDGVYDFRGERLIYCKTLNDLPIGRGDSGSPILTEDNKIIGALCYGFYGNNTQFAARAIEDMLALDDDNQVSSPNENLYQSSYRDISPIHFASGIDQELLDKYQENRFESISGTSIEQIDITQYMNRKSKHNQNDSIIAGNSIAVNIISGDFINFGAIGTLSYQNSDKLFGFGHSFSWAKALAAPVYSAKMISFIESSYVSFKIAVPSTTKVGSLIDDQFEGILISKSESSKTFPVLAHVSIEGHGEKVYNHSIANLIDLGDEYYLTRYTAAYSTYRIIRPVEFDRCDFKIELKAELNGETIIETREYEDSRKWYVDYAVYRFVYDELRYKENSLKNVEVFVTLEDLE